MDLEESSPKLESCLDGGSDSTAKGKAAYGNNWDVAVVVALAVLALGPGCVLADPPEWICSILRAGGHGVAGGEGVGVNLCSGLRVG